jgi:hypothetical protein
LNAYVHSEKVRVEQLAERVLGWVEHVKPALGGELPELSVATHQRYHLTWKQRLKVFGGGDVKKVGPPHRTVAV